MSRPNMTNFGRSGPSAMPAEWGVWFVIVLIAAPFLIAFLGAGRWMIEFLSLVPASVGQMPWTILTYPLADSGNGGGFLGVVLGCVWAYMVCRPIEKETGSPLLAILCLVFIFIGGLALASGAFLGAPARIFFGPWLLLGSLTVLWAARNPEATVLLMMLIPVKAKWIAALSAGSILFGYGTGSPLVGVAALLPLAFALAYGLNKIPGVTFGKTPAESKAKKQKDKDFVSFMDDVRKREKEREERERLRRLFESSLSDDDDPDGKRKGR